MQRLYTVILICVMLLFLAGTPALADTGYDYLDASGVTQIGIIPDDHVIGGGWDTGATIVTGWYAVTGTVSVPHSLTAQGDVHLILTDGASLTVIGGDDYSSNPGIRVSGGNSLTIYGQSAGTGSLTATGGAASAGIGAGSSEPCGAVTINGGRVTANVCWNGSAGIGGGLTGGGGTIEINGGTVTASGVYGAGIGNGQYATGGSVVTINGGTVTASGVYGAGIGGGSNVDGYFEGGGIITINGGTVTASSDSGAGIGGGGGSTDFNNPGSGGNITISGGVVNATSVKGAGIGGGSSYISYRPGGNGGNITISGGTVTASSNNSPGIGGGITADGSGDGGTVTISGGTVNAVSGIQATPTNGSANGNQTVYLTRPQLENMSAVTAVTGLTVPQAPYYGTQDLYTDGSGTLYLYLPSGAAATEVRTADHVYSGSISAQGSGMLLELASDSALSMLALSEGTLSPVFSAGTLAYSASVPYSTSSITVTATASDAGNASLTVNGAAAASGSPTAGIPLSVGENTITVVCTAQDSIHKTTYTITVTRQSPPNITTVTLPDGMVNSPYSVTLTATGTTPITWTVTVGALPAGLTLSPDGTLSGTPTASGAFPFTVQAENSESSASQALSMVIDPAPVYSASLTPGAETFLSAIEGYSIQTAREFMVTNTGTGQLTNLSAQLTGAAAFEISAALPGTSLTQGSSMTLFVRPVTGLAAGTYTDTLTITGENGINLTASLSFTVQSASYAISVTPLSKTFASAAEGTAPPAGETFTVINEGNMAVTLTQPTATNYIIGALSALSLNPLETATFTVAPKSGLTEGSYTETITIQGSNGASAQAEVRFTVTEALSYAIGTAPASMTFDSLAEGYLPPDAKTVTITNTGNQSISLYQPTASRYTIGTLSATSLAPAGTATFTVVPKDDQAAGTWNETIHIYGSNGVHAQVDAAFTCSEPLNYYIISGDGSTYQQDDPDSPDITVTANGDIDKFTGLTLNGELVDESNYDVREGSTIVILHQDFLDTLIPGTYTLTFHYTDGQAQAGFVVHETMPVTGDNDALLLFGSLIVLSLAALILIRKRQALR